MGEEIGKQKKIEELINFIKRNEKNITAIHKEDAYTISSVGKEVPVIVINISVVDYFFERENVPVFS